MSLPHNINDIKQEFKDIDNNECCKKRKKNRLNTLIDENIINVKSMNISTSYYIFNEDNLDLYDAYELYSYLEWYTSYEPYYEGYFPDEVSPYNMIQQVKEYKSIECLLAKEIFNINRIRSLKDPDYIDYNKYSEYYEYEMIEEININLENYFLDVKNENKIISKIMSTAPFMMIDNKSSTIIGTVKELLSEVIEDITLKLSRSFNNTTTTKNKLKYIFKHVEIKNVYIMLNVSLKQAIFYTTLAKALQKLELKKTVSKELIKCKEILNNAIQYDFVDSRCIDFEKINDWVDFIAVRLDQASVTFINILSEMNSLDKDRKERLIKMFKIKDLSKVLNLPTIKIATSE